MVVTRNLQDMEQVTVPANCPQFPGGGYDLIGGARREFLLQRMNEALNLFQENGELDELLNTMQTLVAEGLGPEDLDKTLCGDGSESLFIGCRETAPEGEEPHIEITVVDNDIRYTVEVRKSQVKPIKTFELSGCPLVGSGEQPGCNPETCKSLQRCRDKTVRGV